MLRRSSFARLRGRGRVRQFLRFGCFLLGDGLGSSMRSMLPQSAAASTTSPTLPQSWGRGSPCREFLNNSIQQFLEVAGSCRLRAHGFGAQHVVLEGAGEEV